MTGRSILIGYMVAVAVAVSGIAASDAFAEPEIALTLRDNQVEQGNDQTFLRDAWDVKVFTYNSRIYAVVAGAGEGIHLLDITNPDSIDPLLTGGVGNGTRNVQPSTGRAEAVAVYTVGGKPYFIATWAVSNAIQAFKIAEPGDVDGDGGAIVNVGRVVNRPNPLGGSSLAGASDLVIYSVGNKQYAAITAEGADRLAVVDVTDPNALGTANIAGQIIDSGNLELDGPSGVEHYQTNNRHYAVVVSSADDGIQIVDITNPASPTAAGHLTDTADLELDGAEGVAIYSVGGRTYAVVAANEDDGIQIVDITDPANIFPAGKLADTGGTRLDRAHDLAIHQIGDRHYAVVGSVLDRGVQIVDVTNPYNPVPKATIGEADNTSAVLNGVTGADTFSIGNRHYAIVTSDGDSGVQIIEMTAVNAEAGDGLSVDAGRTVVLDGSGSVSSGATPTYQWTQTGGTTVTLSAPTALRTTFTAPSTPSTLIFQLAATHGGATSTDIVTVSVAPDAVGSPDKTAVDLALTDSVADSAYTYLAAAQDVKVFEHNGKIYAVVASNNDSVHLLDITDPSNINELRHPNPESQSGGNNYNDAAGGESAVPYVAIDGNLYIMLSWATSDAVQSFYIHSNGRLDELAATVDNSKMDYAADLIIYTLQTRCDAAPKAVLITDERGRVSGCLGTKIIGMAERDRAVVGAGDPVERQYAAVIGQLSHSIRIVDVTDPRDLGYPALKGQITDSAGTLLRGPVDIAHYQTNNRHYVVVASSQENGIQIVDVTNPNNPTAAGKLADTGELEMGGTEGVAIYGTGGRIYVVVTGNSDDGLQIVDITDPNNIFPAGKLQDTGELELDNPRGVAVHQIGDRHYAVVVSSADDGIQVVDVTDPYNPVPKGKVDDSASSSAELDGATGIDTFSIGNRHYVVAASVVDHGVQIAEMAVLTADAGDDRVIPGRTAQIPLDGSASTVSSGESPTYQWTQTGGPPVTLSTPTIAVPNFAPPAPPQVLSFLLTVSHGNAQAVDTVTVTLEGNPSTDVASFGGQIVSEAIEVGTVTNATGGTSQYISMHFAGEGESQTFTYRLLEAPSGTVTVSFETLVQSAPYGKPGYTWDLNAVSASPKTLTFTPSNWYTPQVVTVTSQTDGDSTSEQVIIVITSSVPGSYSGIHVTVDDRPSHGTSGTSGGPVFESAQSPVITLAGPYIMDVQLNSAWTDPGYTATDADGNDITASVTISGAVDTTTAATYLLYYQVADAYGTPATPQIRTVNVIAPEPQQQTQQPQPQPQQTQQPQPEPEPEPKQEPEQEPTQEPEQEPTQEPQQEPEQEPTQEPEQEPEQTQEPEQEPEQTQEPEQEPEGTESDQQPTCDIPAIVRQYDADGSCKIEQSEWQVAIADYTADPPQLTTPQIQQIAAHRG